MYKWRQQEPSAVFREPVGRCEHSSVVYNYYTSAHSDIICLSNQSLGTAAAKVNNFKT